MIPVLQDSFYDESTPEGRTRGNCWSAAIASVMELPLEEVPNFVQIDDEGGKDWWDHTMEFIYDRGFVVRQHSIEEVQGVDEYYVVTGQSYRFEGGHAVVYHGWNMAHDPFPGGMGVARVWGIYSIREK